MGSPGSTSNVWSYRVNGGEIGCFYKELGFLIFLFSTDSTCSNPTQHWSHPVTPPKSMHSNQQNLAWPEILRRFRIWCWIWPSFPVTRIKSPNLSPQPVWAHNSRFRVAHSNLTSNSESVPKGLQEVLPIEIRICWQSYKVRPILRRVTARTTRAVQNLSGHSLTWCLSWLLQKNVSRHSSEVLTSKIPENHPTVRLRDTPHSRDKSLFTNHKAEVGGGGTVHQQKNSRFLKI